MTYNICTNQSLIALAFVVYASLVGPRGLAALQLSIAEKARTLASALGGVEGIQSPRFDAPYLGEFVVGLKQGTVSEFLERLRRKRVLGGVPLAETVRFYQAADVFVYPSFNETFGLPILEAMACGCPVVTANTTAMPETAGGAAVLCDPGEPASIARAIGEAMGPGRDRLIDGGFRRAAQFTWGATAASTLDVYREVAERKRHGSK